MYGSKTLTTFQMLNRNELDVKGEDFYYTPERPRCFTENTT
jgi:hypothetical protein